MPLLYTDLVNLKIVFLFLRRVLSSPGKLSTDSYKTSGASVVTGLIKSFGRHTYNTYVKNEDMLIRLSEIFNHSSPKVTKTYLRIRQKELVDNFEWL
jgi:hypothetical protein